MFACILPFFLIVILTCFSGKYADFDGQYLASRGLATTDDSKSNFCNHRKISNDGAATSVQSDIFPNSFFKPKKHKLNDNYVFSLK
jgi:hypothetical protein